MIFSSVPFLYYFLPCVLLLYFIAPTKLKNLVLLLTSLFFYAWGEPKFALVMLLTITQGYIFGILIEKSSGARRKAFLIITVIISLSILVYCKYADFFIENFNAVFGSSVPLLKITLPIGISFYTFQILSYNVDVYRGGVPAQKNYINLAAYIAMFPQLIAGPIVRYSDIAAQLEKREHTAEKCALGIRRFVVGLSKKVLLANTLGELCSIFKESGDKSLLFFWMYAVAYALHIYFDFSGYSDMAIGLCKIFGFDFVENFNYPFISKTVTEFWRRWHMSLGSWFRDYVYIPMGGNRVSKPRWFFNIFVVWMLTGLWHGAAWNFVVWGLFFAVLLTAEKMLYKEKIEKTKVLCRIYIFLAVIVSFVIFDSADLGSAFTCIKSLFGAGGYPIFSTESVYYLKSYAVLFVVGLVGCTPLPSLAVRKISENRTARKAVNLLEPLYLTALILVVTGFIVDGSYNPFLYFRF